MDLLEARRTKRAGRRLFCGLAAIGMVVAGGGAQAVAAPTTSITFTLDFSISSAHAWLYTALEKGWYKQAGLNITVEPTGGSSDSLSRVAAGSADLGIASATTVLDGMASNQLPVKVVAMLNQHDESATTVLKSSGVTSIKQLAGKTVGVPPSSSEASFFPAILKKNGVDPSKVHTVSISNSALVPTLLAGKVQGANAFGSLFASNASQVTVLPWYRYGLSIYGSTIIGNTSFLSKNAQAVRSFLKVSVRGIQYAVTHPAQAGQIVAKAAQQVSPASYQAQWKVNVPYFKGSSTIAGAEMSTQRWTQTQSVNVQYGGQKKSLPLGSVYTNGYLQ